MEDVLAEAPAGREAERQVDARADEPLAQLDVDPGRTTVFLCGPEPMMRFCAQMLAGKKVPAERIRLSLERNMKCGVARCGHCQLGPLLLCRDGPVVDYAVAEPLLAVREL